MKINALLSITAIIFSGIIPPLAAQEYDKILKELDTYADNAVKQWQVPGLSITVVRWPVCIYKIIRCTDTWQT